MDFHAYLSHWRRRKLVVRLLLETGANLSGPIRHVEYHCTSGRCGRCFTCAPRTSVPIALKDL